MLNEIRLQSPCKANWDEMEGNGTVRFCAHCKANVHNLSSLTRKEAESLIANAKGSLCVKYYRDVRGKLVTADAQAPLFPAHPKVLAASFSALLSLPIVSLAQQPDSKPQARITVENRLQQADDLTSVPHFPVRGKITDPAQQLVTGAKVVLTNEVDQQKRFAISDQAGEFRFTELTDGRYALAVEASGFNKFALHPLNVSAKQELFIEVNLHIGPLICETVQVNANGAIYSSDIGTLAVVHRRSWWQWIVHVVTYPFKQGGKVPTR